MPTAKVNGTELFYEDTGKGKEAIVFSHGLLIGHFMFRRQVEHLKGRYRCIAYDHRGQGNSARTTGRAISMDTCYEDAAALIEALGVGPVHFAGLSMGGFVGLRLGARRPELVKSLILLNTSADPEPGAAIQYRIMNFIARYFGPGLVAKKVMPILFGTSFLDDPQRHDEAQAVLARLKSVDKAIWRAVNGAIERAGVEDEARTIKAPTLVIAGGEDAAINPEITARIAELVPKAKLVTLPNAGHTSSIEDPDGVNAAIDDFLKGLAPKKSAPRKMQAKKRAAGTR